MEIRTSRLSLSKSDMYESALTKAVEPSEELKDMNRKKVWGQYESKYAAERYERGVNM